MSDGARILLVDDEPSALRGEQRALAAAGFQVVAEGDGEAALARVTEGFDCVVSDLQMPGIDGIQLLRRVREHDLDVPVVLVTGAPSIESAIRAVEHGALRYLTKPVTAATLAETVREAVRLGAMARAKREALALLGDGRMNGDRAGLEATFARALRTIHMAYQPIVHARGQRTFAFEALLRSDDPALRGPAAMLDAAERLGEVRALGRAVRALVAAALPAAPSDAVLFVNLHPRDLLDDDLFAAGAPLTRFGPRVVLEITERASLDQGDAVRARLVDLRALGFRLAVDDLGAGYAGLATFASIEPEIVKIDMSLVRGIDASPVKRRVVARMTELAHDLGMQVVAEGIESVAERDVLVDLGCDLLQGYLFARPGPPFPTACFPGG